MATLSFHLSSKTDKTTGLNEILARFVVGSRINQRAKTNIFAPAEYWNQDSQVVTVPSNNIRFMTQERLALVTSLNDTNKRLQDLKAFIMESFIKAGAGKKPLEKNWLSDTVDRFNFPELHQEVEVLPITLVDAFDDYLENKAAPLHAARIRVVRRSLLRFQKYRELRNEGGALELDTVTADDIRAFENYMKKEADIVAQYPALKDVCQESREILARSENTIIGRMRIVRTIMLYAVKNGRTTNNPFQHYSIPEAVYGTPIYITLAELQHLYNFDLSKRPKLSIQRDIFVFQCLIGCRVSDLLKLTRRNLIDGGIEYVPQKTKDDRPRTVRVPLNRTAAEIVARYEDKRRVKLLPFISSQKYNDSIKEAFTLAGLTRMVTVLDQKTRQEVQKPLNEIASSHLARRTFVGNLYKQVRDPNLIAKLSGHTEGSRAFARYRDIDEEIRRDLVNMLDK